jgi:hypothetical protein
VRLIVDLVILAPGDGYRMGDAAHVPTASILIITFARPLA